MVGSDKILNPKTGRYVARNGAIGIQIIENNILTKTTKNAMPVKKTASKHKTPTFTKVPLKFRIEKKQVRSVKQQTINKKITVELLLKKLDDPTFINDFKNSLVKLVAYKKQLYIKPEMLPQPLKNKTPWIPNPNPYSTMLTQIIEIEKFLDSESANAKIKLNLMSAITNSKFGMKSLVGRQSELDYIAGLLFAFSRNCRIFTRVFMNFSIFGGAGLGKSALAKVISFVFKKSFILLRGNIVMGTSQELVSNFVGETAQKTRTQLFDALEGILFIDEAYSLTPCQDETSKSGEYGLEAIAELINFMDKTIGLMVIMVAGYEDKMTRCFFTSNEGLNRRFPYTFNLKPYSSIDLTKILINSMLGSEIQMSEPIYNLIYSIISDINDNFPDLLKNQAGDMTNLSNSIIQSIYMSIEHDWNASFNSQQKIILDAFQTFLSQKGFNLSFDD